MSSNKIKTYAYALKITPKRGKPYIWIDSLSEKRKDILEFQNSYEDDDIEKIVKVSIREI